MTWKTNEEDVHICTAFMGPCEKNCDNCPSLKYGTVMEEG